MNSNYLARQFKEILRAAGPPVLRLYDLRHTAATLALAAGVSPKVVSEQLGYANRRLVASPAAHAAEAAQRVQTVFDAYGGVLKAIAAGCRKSPESANLAVTDACEMRIVGFEAS